MKILILILLSFSMEVFAAAENQSTTSVKPSTPLAKPNKKAQTDMSFEDLLVNGQYHFSDEAVTTVEEDKVLNSLIGVRKDFKDRIKQAATLGEVKK